MHWSGRRWCSPGYVAVRAEAATGWAMVVREGATAATAVETLETEVEEE